MKRKMVLLFGCALLLLAEAACSKHVSGTQGTQLVVEIPAGFSGDFLLEMGAQDRPPLEKRGDVYVVTVPRTGKVVTSTLLQNPKVEFKNASDGGVWGYSQSVFTTGDGISVGGKIEFFVGTQKEYDAEKQKKEHSGDMPIWGDSVRSTG
jgi:hypothetical protein